jgi:hypothetical protein
VRPGGIVAVFIRDTTRKDILFPAGQLVRDALCTTGDFQEFQKRSVIVRHHLGLRRKDAAGLYGLAQREWWLCFKRRDG